MQYVETATKGLNAGGAIARYILVKWDGTDLAAAGLNEEFIGVADAAALAADEIIPVRLKSAQGTMICTAAGAFSAGAAVYGRAAGKVDDIASGAIRVGIALTAAAAAGDLVEVVPDGA
jgi:hypothetical protein